MNTPNNNTPATTRISLLLAVEARQSYNSQYKQQTWIFAIQLADGRSATKIVLNSRLSLRVILQVQLLHVQPCQSVACAN